MTIKQELLSLQEASDDGLLHVETAERWARDNVASALHRALTWDDAVAAREYRYDQIRSLIRLHVVMADDTPMMVSLSFDRTKGGGYRSVSDVVANKTLSEIMLADALAELERVRLKYARVEQLTGVWRQVEVVRARRGRPRRQGGEAQATAG